ncbi:integration host factor subunit beta [Ferribacterium limneticum]|uniref:integration host factor subunit beta n=1 Tax=Ferribacterium limneticum TaxID=76259 RepID=UPI001CFA60F2|nr:integration host factor subunit beta [Ferribacterium limneticum]UCV17923.1 integration host factor subunit beta [Ferribacterium limneticum]
MTRSELIASLSQRFPQLVLKDAELSVAEILGALGNAISRGGRVEIRGFGSFSLNYRPPRIGRNPRTGERVNIPEKWTPHFKPGKELRELVNAA